MNATLPPARRHAIVDLFQTRYAATRTQIGYILQYESTPYTQNGHYLQVTKDKYLARYKDVRAGKVKFNADGESPIVKKRRTQDGGNGMLSSYAFTCKTDY